MKPDSTAFDEGAVWLRRKTAWRHEVAIEIVHHVYSQYLGERYRVRGLKSGRQWTLSHATLLATYEPRKGAS